MKPQLTRTEWILALILVIIYVVALAAFAITLSRAVSG